QAPYWATVDGMVATASPVQIAKSAPRVLAMVARRAWNASAALTILTVAVQLLSGLTTAFGLLATANVFISVLEEGPSLQRIISATPSLLLVVAAYSVHGLLDAAIGLLRGALLPRIEQLARDELHAIVLEVDLSAFEDADFVESLCKAAGSGLT